MNSKKKKLKTNPASISQVPKPESTFNKSLKKYWKLIVALGVIIGIIGGFDPLKKFFRSSKSNYDKEKFKEGKLAPLSVSSKSKSFAESPPIYSLSPVVDSSIPVKGLMIDSKLIETSGGLWVSCGGVLSVIDYATLSDGLKFTIPSKECDTSSIYLIMKNDRIYISAEFKDLQKEQFIGSIEYNHWRIYLDNLLDWEESDYSLEVRDKQNYIVCSVFTEPAKNSLTISGYFMTTNSIDIYGSKPSDKIYECFSKSDSNWKQKAESKIATIKSIFNNIE